MIEIIKSMIDMYDDCLWHIDQLIANAGVSSDNLFAAKQLVIESLKPELIDLCKRAGLEYQTEDLCEFCLIHIKVGDTLLHIWYDDERLGITCEESNGGVVVW